MLWIEELSEEGCEDKAKRNQTIKVKTPTCKTPARVAPDVARTANVRPTRLSRN
jgi:hypothetical protein